MEKLPVIRQAIVVEGRDDQAALARAVDAYTIATHGFGIKQETLELIEKAYKNQGIIVFTDPDHAGQKIRERLAGLFPDAVHAFLTRGEAEKAGDIGIENASPESIRQALERALKKAPAEDPAAPAPEPITKQDLFDLGLSGLPDSMDRREQAGRLLGIGGGNTKSFLKKLNSFHITGKELQDACLAYKEPTK